MTSMISNLLVKPTPGLTTFDRMEPDQRRVRLVNLYRDGMIDEITWLRLCALDLMLMVALALDVKNNP